MKVSVNLPESPCETCPIANREDAPCNLGQGYVCRKFAVWFKTAWETARTVQMVNHGWAKETHEGCKNCLMENGYCVKACNMMKCRNWKVQFADEMVSRNDNNREDSKQ